MKRGLTTWENGLLITKGFEEVECSKCTTFYMYDTRRKTGWVKREEPVEIRFFKNSHGYLCKRCFEKAPLCECGDIATVQPENKCRNCFIGKEEKRPFEELLYRG